MSVENFRNGREFGAASTPNPETSQTIVGQPHSVLSAEEGRELSAIQPSRINPPRSPYHDTNDNHKYLHEIPNLINEMIAEIKVQHQDYQDFIEKLQKDNSFFYNKLRDIEML